MMINKAAILAGVAVIGTTIALAASAEISGVKEGLAARRPNNADSLRVVSGEALRLQCWQNGVQIIDETSLGGISVKSLLEQESLLLGNGREAARVIVLSLEQSTCLVRPGP